MVQFTICNSAHDWSRKNHFKFPFTPPLSTNNRQSLQSIDILLPVVRNHTKETHRIANHKRETQTVQKTSLRRLERIPEGITLSHSTSDIIWAPISPLRLDIIVRGWLWPRSFVSRQIPCVIFCSPQCSNGWREMKEKTSCPKRPMEGREVINELHAIIKR